MDDLDLLDAGEPAPEPPPKKGKGGARGGKEKGEKTKLCYVCSEKKLSNSRFCRPHHRAYEAIKYQVRQVEGVWLEFA